jgi:4a-hydroxytetrahydrobiopterin dehydratase
MDLETKHCVPCEGGVAPLTQQEAENLMGEIPGWTLQSDGKTISNSLSFNNFANAFAFATKVATLAEEEGHHPDLFISWGKVEIKLSTHAIGGLSENDFILAAKINQIV